MRVIGKTGRRIWEFFSCYPCYGDNLGRGMPRTGVEVPKTGDNPGKSFFDIVDEHYKNAEEREQAIYTAKYSGGKGK